MKKKNNAVSLQFSNLVFLFAGIVSLLIFFYSAYKLQDPHAFQTTKFYIMCLIISSFLSVLFFWVIIKLNNDLKLNLSITLIIVFFSFYIFETYLFFSNLKSYRQNPDKQFSESIIKAARDKGINYDTRTKLEVLKDLEISGETVYPNLIPEFFRETNGLGEENNKIFPLGGIANTKVILPNELGYFPIYETDKYGFKNPSQAYNKDGLDIVLIGDSFTEGSSVHQNKNIAEILRNFNYNVINLGMAGNGPLIELATLKEYAKQLKPKIILWMFCSNDLENLKYEMSSSILKKYLEDDNYSQNLILKQNEINILLKSFIKKEKKIKSTTKEVNNNYIRIFSDFFNIIKLSNIRVLLKINLQFTEKRILPLKEPFKEIIKNAKKTTSDWGGKMYFVYIPRSLVVIEQKRVESLRNFVLNTNKELNIDIIDLENDLLNDHPDPLSLIPFRTRGHFNEKGYFLIAETIHNRIKNDGYISIKFKN